MVGGRQSDPPRIETPFSGVPPKIFSLVFPMRSLFAALGVASATLLFAAPLLRSNGVSAGTAVRLDVSQLTHNSALIVEGRVLSAATVEAEGLIQTEYLLEVDRTFAGDDESYRMVRLPGGVREDGTGMLLAGMPRIELGDESLFFLTGESHNGMRMPVGLAQGKFDVVELADGTKSLVRDASDVTLVNSLTGRVSSAGGHTILDYARVVAEIEAALAEKRGR